MIKITNRIIYNVILPILLGGVIYMVTGRNTVAMSWLLKFHLTDIHDWLLEITVNNSLIIPYWISMYLPDVIWAYTISYLLCIIWKTNGNIAHDKYILILAVLISISIEIMQLLGVIQGTFCYIDLTLSVLSAIIAYAIINNKILRGITW